MRAIIVEDEENVRAGFNKMLDKFFPDIQVVAEAGSVAEGKDVLSNNICDLLFLDINLPDGTGFDLVKNNKDQNFHIIFITAYDQYAVDAFKVSAADYLLKPISPDDLRSALDKIQSESEETRVTKRSVLLDNAETSYSQKEKMILNDIDSLKIVEIQDILYCQADGSYTRFFFTDGNKIVVSSHLKEYDRLLDPYGFMRCHHSYLVNLDQVVSIHKSDSTVILSNEDSIPISFRKKPVIIQALRNRFIG